MVFQWSEDLTVGVEVIDQQHKGIFSRVNILLSAMAQGKGGNEVGTVVLFLSDYVIKHFRAEEDLMIRHNYDGYASQKAEHMKFIKDFSLLKNEFETHGITSPLALQTQQLLCDWLKNHIVIEDKKLGIFLNVGV